MTRRVWTDADETALLGLYVKGQALSDIAARLARSEATVRDNMVRLDLPRLPRGRPPGRCNGALTKDAEPIE